jgi:hypothetical protein
MGAPDPPGPEVLGHGREPDPYGAEDLAEHAHRPRPRLPRGTSAALVVLALVAGGLWYAGRPDLGGRAGGTDGSTTRGSDAPVPDATTLVSGLAEAHDLQAPAAPALDSFIASGGHVLLFLQVANVGHAPLRIVGGVVPQTGASRDLTAGGLSAGTSGGGPLNPGDQAEVFVRLTVRCPQVLDGAAAKAVLLVSEEQGRHPRLERVPMDALGTYWEEARQAACRVADADRDVTAGVVPGSVRAVRSDDGSLTVSGVISFHDAAGFAAVVTGPAVAMGGGGRLVVDGGSTRSVPMRWAAGTCAKPAAPITAAAAPRYVVDLPQQTAAGRVGLDDRFASEWTAELREVCAHAT